MFFPIPAILITCLFIARCPSVQVTPISLQLSTLVTAPVTSISRRVTATTSRARTALTLFSPPLSSTTKDLTATAGLSAHTKVVGGIACVNTAIHPGFPKVLSCNGYPEFCERKFSNVSMVVAHNSPFVKPHNAASNQMYPVLSQLNDGVRGLQFQTQKPYASSEIRLCHTSCDILDVGTLQSYLTTVRGWLDSHPYEVIAIIMGNANGHDIRIPISEYVAPFSQAGMLKYVWTPSSPTMNLTQWPTLAEMILKNKRVVVMLDYGTNQAEVPWLMSEFSYQWETPFSPTNSAFPCTEQRPPNQTESVSRNRMYMLNHNLNIDVDIGASIPGMKDFLVPALNLLEEVNAVSGDGSLGLNIEHCEQMWGRPPNFLLVDYYNYGNFNGSVFQVAANANNVTYTPKSCCGQTVTGAANRTLQASTASLFCWAFFLFFCVINLGPWPLSTLIHVPS